MSIMREDKKPEMKQQGERPAPYRKEGPGGFSYERVAPPASVLDVPRFLKELFSGFFYRLFYIFRLVWQTGPWILFVMMFIALFSGIMPVVGSMISKNILNSMQEMIVDRANGTIVGDFLHSDVMYLLIFLFTYRIANRIVGRVEGSVTRIAGEKVVRHVKLQIMEKAKEIDVASYDMPEFYERLENANREAGNRPIHILSSTFSVISTVISFVSYIVIISTAIPVAALCIIAVSVPSAIVNFIFRRKNFQYMRFRSKERRQMNYYAEIVTSKDRVKEVRMFGLEDTFINKYKQVFDNYYRGLRGLILHESFWNVGFAILSAVTNCVFYALIAAGVFNGIYMIGDYSLYTNSLSSIGTCVSTLISTSASIYEGTLFIDNLIAFMKTEKTVCVTSEEPRVLRRGEPHTIQFENVSFSYPGFEKRVIDNVNLTLRPGETVVLVGLNGAGKTTLLKLLTRLYDPTEGRILLDGVDIREYEPRELYSMFGIIFQDFGRYACTVEENIMFGEIGKQPDHDRVVDSAKAANVEEYIQSLPDAYDTPLTRFFERTGTELSGGQWQKLAIARAFYADSDVLILDEPTAALDAIAEQEIYNQFESLRKDKTTIYVSHRLSSATTASKIVVLEYGKIIEEGTHKELMAKEGRYYELFTTQAKHYIESAADIHLESDRPHRRPHHDFNDHFDEIELH